MSSPATKPLRIGALLSNTVQLLDLAAIDLFAIMAPEYLAMCSLPQSLVDLAVPSEIHYIGSHKSPANLTANLSINLTDDLASNSVGPGNLDLLVIPGPDPTTVPAEDILAFVRAHHGVGTTILTICTGCQVAAYAGIFDGKRATGPRTMIPGLRQQFPKVKEWDESSRVVRDGNLWSSGSISNGLDLVVAYLRETYPAPLVNLICAIAEIAERPHEYQTDLKTDLMQFSGK